MSYNPANSGTPLVARAAARSAANTTGITIFKFTPVKLGAGGMAPLVPTIETDVDAFVGVARNDVLNTGSGDIINAGLLEDVAGGYAPGETVYVSKTGAVTNVKPTDGGAGFVAGDFIIKIGVIAENNVNSALRDCIICIQIMGQI